MRLSSLWFMVVSFLSAASSMVLCDERRTQTCIATVVPNVGPHVFSCFEGRVSRNHCARFRSAEHSHKPQWTQKPLANRWCRLRGDNHVEPHATLPNVTVVVQDAYVAAPVSARTRQATTFRIAAARRLLARSHIHVIPEKPFLHRAGAVCPPEFSTCPKR